MKSSKNIWDKTTDLKTIQKTAESLKARSIAVEIVENRKEALEKLKEIIPEKAEIMTGSSTTLEQIGLIELLESGNHPWENLKDKIMAEEDKSKQNELRKRSSLSEYFLGSVHAVAETGEIVVASATGSQLAAYVFTSPHVVWVVGTQKITPDLESAIKRLREYVYPLEDKRMKSEGYPGSMIGKILIFEKEFVPERITLIFVKEKLGF